MTRNCSVVTFVGAALLRGSITSVFSGKYDSVLPDSRKNIGLVLSKTPGRPTTKHVAESE